MNIWHFCRKSRRLYMALLLTGTLLLFCAGCGGNSISFENADVTLSDVTVNGDRDETATDTVLSLAETTETTAEDAQTEAPPAETEQDVQALPEKAASETTGAADDAPETTQSTDAEEQAYVVNTNSGKFHYPDCESVKDMKSKNRSDRVCSRETLISEGFVPCKRCNP